jgi:Holliday junction resolvase RusA-like endonuclease
MPVKHNKITLPLPPSVNHCYKRGQQGHLFLSDAAIAWKEEAVLRLKLLHMKPYLPTEKVIVGAFVIWPDNRRRDCDNLAKLTQDVIQQAGIVEDDRYLLWQVWNWMVQPKNGRLQLTIFKKGEDEQ